MFRTLATTVAFVAVATAAAAQPQPDRLVHELPQPAQYVATYDVVYAENAATHAKLRFDIVRPRSTPGSAPAPVVLFLNGVGSPELRKAPQFAGWTKLVTTAGLAGIAQDTEEGAIEQNFEALLATLRVNARAWNIDPSRVAVVAWSSNVYTGLPLITNPRHPAVKAGAILYGYANVREFRPDVPLLVARAALDFPSLNRGLDTFVGHAMAANVPITVLALSGAHHGFDLYDDNDDSRAAIDGTLAFLDTSLRTDRIAARVRESREAAAAGALYAQDWPTAAARYRDLIRAEPQRAALHVKLGEALGGTDDLIGALAAYRTALDLGDPNEGLISLAAAKLALRLNDRALAFRWLVNLRCAERSGFCKRVRNDPALAPLRDDPRFTEIFGV